MTDRITRDPAVKSGKPIINGLRITVEDVLRWLSLGSSPKEIVAHNPSLNIEDIQAALAYAADFMAARTGVDKTSV